MASAGLALATTARPAAAAEGALAVRPGDTFRGTLERCLDRHVAEVELMRGEVFRLRVRLTEADSHAVQLRVLDPEGWLASSTANVRLSGADLLAGPFRVPVSGTWRFEVSTPTAHGAAYEATTDVRRTRAVSAVLGRRGRGAVVAAPAGATLRLRGANLPVLSLRGPGDVAGETLAADSATLAALRGDGLAAARAGSYEFSVESGRGRGRVMVSPPAAVAPAIVEFPILPRDGTAVASWQGPAGWVIDPARTAPDEKGVMPPLPPAPPTTSPFSGDVVADCPAAGEASADATLDDADVFAGPSSGVGLPVAGIPALADVLREGEVAVTSAGPVYTLVRESALLGEVTTRVWFLVEGRPSRAPVALDGRVTMRWEDLGGTQALQGAWTLSFDAVRGVQALDGGETRTPDGVRTVTVGAEGFALPTTPGRWPQGRLALAWSDPRLGPGFTRTESFDGGPSVTVAIVRTDGSSESVVHTGTR